jgi:hypothetical protein
VALRYRDHLTDPDGAGPIEAGDDNLADWVWLYDGGDGAVLESFGGGDLGTDPDVGDPDDPGDPNDPAGYLTLNINGTPDELNDALANLVFIPDADYRYTDSGNEAAITVTLVSGDPNDPDSRSPGRSTSVSSTSTASPT